MVIFMGEQIPVKTYLEPEQLEQLKKVKSKFGIKTDAGALRFIIVYFIERNDCSEGVVD